MNKKTKTMYGLYTSGLSLAEVGKVFGVTRQSVYDRFKKQHLKLRPLKKKPFIIAFGYKFTINSDGYYECTTVDRLMLHNLVWENKNGKIPFGYQIHHIDFNKINNDISNLQLVTPEEHTKIHVDTHWFGSGMNKRVKCVETGEIFKSITEVAKKHNQHPSNVSRYYIDGKRKLQGFTYEKI